MWHPPWEAAMTDKFAALVHYIVHSCDPNQLGAIRLNKALWYIDILAYQTWGKPVTGETYRRQQFGPVPGSIMPVLGDLARDGKIAIQKAEYAYETTKFFSLREPDKDALTPDEKRLASVVLDALLERSANAISELTHDVIWRAARDGQEIPLHATLVAVAGEVTPEMIQWADQKIADAHGTAGA